MEKQNIAKLVLLAWSKEIPFEGGADPLSVNLRVGARLVAQLSHCITSITPRARYYAFIPWCIQQYREKEKGTVYDVGLRKSIEIRELALTLGSVACHGGEECDGGSLIGSIKAKEWYQSLPANTIDLLKREYVKIPAWKIYFNSIVQLGLLKTGEQTQNNPEEGATDEVIPEVVFDDLELTPLGEELAKKFGENTNGLSILDKFTHSAESISVEELKRFGEKCCLCALGNSDAQEKEFLRNLFFNNFNGINKSHQFRRHYLLLLLSFIEQLSEKEIPLTENNFRDAVYFGCILKKDRRIEPVTIKPQLKDIRERYRMFYFHYFIGTALEGVFASLVEKAKSAGLSGFELSEFFSELQKISIKNEIAEYTGVDIPSSFWKMSPRDLLGSLGIHLEQFSAETVKNMDTAISIEHPLNESRLRNLLEKPTIIRGPLGPALGFILLFITLIRYQIWRPTQYGHWLSNTIFDPYMDITASNLAEALSSRFEKWIDVDHGTLIDFITRKYVVHLHEVLALDKRYDGSRAFFTCDNGLIQWHGKDFDKVTVHHPRFENPLKVLADLGLIKNLVFQPQLFHLTDDGSRLLHKELSKE